jgi:ribosomal protein L40E
MPKRRSDADCRIFFDQLVSVGVSRLRASGAIRLEDRQALIPFGDKSKLIGVAHTRFPNGGSWSYFICPRCGARSKKLWLVDDAPRCRRCLEKLGVRYRASYGFGRTERQRERDRRIDRLQAMLEGGPLRLKPVPPSWSNRRLDRRNRLTVALHRSRIVTRLALLAYQQQQSSEPHEALPLLRAYKPRAAAIEAIPDLKSLWRARSTEDLERALDKAQAIILQRLQHSDSKTRLRAAKLMLRSRQARERGWS